MALNQVQEYDHNKTRQWVVPAGTLSGAAVISISNEPGVTLTTRGDAVVTKTLADGSVITRPNVAPGVRADSAVVAVDGSWAFPVVGASVTTPKNTLVYAVVAAGAVTSLTLTVGTNTKFGVTDSPLGKALATETTVKIGVFA